MQQRSSESWFQTTFMLTSDEVVKEQTFQMTSKKVLRSSKQQNRMRVYCTHLTSGLKVLSKIRLATYEFENFM